jgi:hypothetical protein
MDSDDLEIRDSDSKRAHLEPKRRFLIWPWLLVFGLLAIAAGVVGPLVRG